MPSIPLRFYAPTISKKAMNMYSLIDIVQSIMKIWNVILISSCLSLCFIIKKYILPFYICGIFFLIVE